MARNPRCDVPGSWHHVVNRAVARRSLFEGRGDIRYFLACLARGVRRGQLEVHAWCVLTTHFHLLVRSPKGELSAAMRRVQNDYVRRFNRGRRRDGPLVRGRFLSRPVRSLEYREILVRYIDRNPVRASLVRRAVDYPWCSAAAYARGTGPRWLSRDWVEDLVRRRVGSERYEPERYAGAFAGEPQRDGLVERRLAAPARARDFDALDHLVQGAPSRVLRWLRAKAQLADGSRPGLPVAEPTAVLEAIARTRSGAPEWTVRPNQRARCGWKVLEVGLLRGLTAATYDEVVERSRISAATARRTLLAHAWLMTNDTAYGTVAVDVAREVIGTVPRQSPPDSLPRLG